MNAAELSAWGRKAVRARWDRVRRWTLARVAARTRQNPEEFGSALREFYREMGLRPDRMLISDRPARTGNPQYDAYLAAVSECVATRRNWPAPDWIFDADRFLSAPYFGNAPAGMRAFLIHQSPLVFRLRNIFVEPQSVELAIGKAAGKGAGPWR